MDPVQNLPRHGSEGPVDRCPRTEVRSHLDPGCRVSRKERPAPSSSTQSFAYTSEAPVYGPPQALIG